MTQYSIVIVARDRPKQLLAAFFALRANAKDVDEVILIDNGSATDLTPIARMSQLPIRIVRLLEHQSFGAAINAGIETARNDLILLLHSDTLIASDPALAAHYLTRHPDIGVIGGKLFAAGQERGLVLHAGYEARPGRIAPHPLGDRVWDVFHEPRSVDAVSSACMMIRRVGLHADERYWFRFEDIDLCYQYLQHSLKVVLHPALTAHHLDNGGVRERLIEPEWAARRVASDLLYHERWCSGLPLAEHPRQPAVRGDEARQHLHRASELIGQRLAPVGVA